LSTSFIASQVFSQLFLSPLLFILPFFVASLFARRAKLFFVFVATVFYFLSTSFATNILMGSLENEFRKPTKIDFKPNAVVVLGSGANAFVPDSKLSQPGYKRFIQALSLAKKMDLPIIFSGGGWVDSDGITEAAAAIESANNLADIFEFARPLTSTLNGGFGLLYDDKSENTLQNAKNTLAIMQLNGESNPKIILVTSASHMKRAKIVFEKHGFKVAPYAVDFVTKGRKISYLDALSDFKNLNNNFAALKEYIGIVKFFIIDSQRSEK